MTRNRSREIVAIMQCGGGLALCALDWQSAATFATGIAAVAGAIAIGIRQSRISLTQARILEKQVDLEERKLNSDLFSRRFGLLQEAINFEAHLAAVTRRMIAPDRAWWERFRVGMWESQFLFRREVHERLLKIWQDHHAAQVAILQIDDPSSTPEIVAGAVESLAALDAVYSPRPSNLVEIFTPDLRMGPGKLQLDPP